MIKILNSSLQRQFIIKKVDTASRYEELNGENTLDFKAVLDNKLANYFMDNSILELDNEYFDIAYSKKEHNHDNSQTLEVEGEHVSYRLNNPVYDSETFVQTGSPSYILGMILSGTGLTVGSVSYGGTITYSVLEKTSRRQLLMGFVNMLGGEVQFDKFSVSILTKRGSRDVQLYTTGKNVDIVSKVVNKRELDTSGNHLVSYVCESILLKNKTVGVGDDILLVQPGLGIRESLRVVSYSYNPYEKYSTQLQITNFVHGIEDELYRIESSTVAKDNIYNGVRIGPNDGFVAEGRITGTDEIRSKTIMNATEGISIYSNTGLNGSLERNFFVDLDGRIKGRELDIAGDATFQGNISASTINSSNIDVDMNVYIGDYLVVGSDTSSTNSKGVEIRHGNNSGHMEIDRYGNMEIWSWGKLDLDCADKLILNSTDMLVDGYDIRIDGSDISIRGDTVLDWDTWVHSSSSQDNLVATLGDIPSMMSASVEPLSSVHEDSAIEAFYDINKCFIDYEGGDYLTVRDKRGVVVGQIDIGGRI